MRLIFDDETGAGKKWEKLFEQAALICLANEGITDACEISVSFVNEDEIRALNRDYRDTDKVTDVLSFPMYEADEIADVSEQTEADIADAGSDEEADEIYMPLGDVVICEDQALRQAEEFGHSYEREVCYLFVHSMLHLLGYDHMEPEEKEVMRVQEEIVMKELNLTREECACAPDPAEIRVFEKFDFDGKSKKEIYEALIAKAKSALQYSFAPFSKFHVGAALLTADDFVCTGVNIENSSYGATICAERTAFVKAISCGVRDFKAIAVVSDAGSAWPCGICRQFMREFCEDDFVIISLDSAGKIKSYTLSELLPEGFRLEK